LSRNFYLGVKYPDWSAGTGKKKSSNQVVMVGKMKALYYQEKRKEKKVRCVWLLFAFQECLNRKI